MIPSSARFVSMKSASSQTVETVTVGVEELEIVHSFCYLGDMIGDTGCCADAITSSVCEAWKKFLQAPATINQSSYSTCNVYSAAVRSVLLYTSVTWPITSEGIAKISCTDNTMVLT